VVIEIPISLNHFKGLMLTVIMYSW